MKFRIYEDKSQVWRWSLISTNGRIVADSAEAYSSKGNVERAVAMVVDGVAALKHLKGDPSKAIEEDQGGLE